MRSLWLVLSAAFLIAVITASGMAVAHAGGLQYYEVGAAQNYCAPGTICPDSHGNGTTTFASLTADGFPNGQLAGQVGFLTMECYTYTQTSAGNWVLSVAYAASDAPAGSGGILSGNGSATAQNVLSYLSAAAQGPTSLTSDGMTAQGFDLGMASGSQRTNNTGIQFGYQPTGTPISGGIRLKILGTIYVTTSKSGVRTLSTRNGMMACVAGGIQPHMQNQINDYAVLLTP